ncbi:hypothetical protein Bbelb_272700 [Branchiostoma belcheri]|nr:hypothetical protein Bbelb_272700 [Branchiostoma belcheri]
MDYISKSSGSQAVTIGHALRAHGPRRVIGQSLTTCTPPTCKCRSALPRVILAAAPEDVLRESAGRCAGLPSGECGTSSGRVRYVLRESAVRPAGECGTFSGSQTFCSSLLEQRKLEVNDLRPACKQDWTGSGCNIKGAGGFC